MNKVLFDKDTFDILKKGVDTLCNAVKVTLGPKGKNVLIINNYGDAHLTKDGITVANNVKSDDPIINGIINVVREASANNAKTVGDGTTTTLVLTQSIFDEGLKLLQEGVNPTILKEGMDKALVNILFYLEEHSEKISIDDINRLEQIAYISANNKEDVANIAVEAVSIAKESGIIKIEDSKTQDTTIKSTNGLTFDKGYLSPYFANGNTTITYENPIIFVSNIELTNNTLVTLMKEAKNNNRPLIIIAPDFNENIFTTMYKNHIAGAVQICPIKCPGFAGNREQWLEDICIYSEATLYKNNNVSPINNIGNVDKIIISKNETSLIHNDMRKGVFEHLRLLDKQLDDATEQYEIDVIRERRSRLAGNIVTIFVGATTELELKEKKDRVEDAVCALQTALKGGISIGGGRSFMNASTFLYDVNPNIDDFILGYNLVMKALLKPFEQLCINSDKDYNQLLIESKSHAGYNFKTDNWENLKETGVIDPTLVLKNAITNAIGIASNLLTTNCITYKE